jgi:hypothetical protein
MRPTYPDHTEAQRGDQSLKDQNRSVESGTLTVAQPHSEENHRAKSWRAIPYRRVVLLSFVFLAALAWTRHNLDGREIPDWKPVLALADTARERGDLYYARNLYLQVGRLAASRDDWAGLLAAACGIKKRDRERGRYSATNMLLLRAMVAAEAKQSRSGMAAVGKAFSALGENKVASMVLSRIRTDWVDKTDDSADVASPGCGDN